MDCHGVEQLGTPVSIYTEPKTKFAAGFIGHYNVMKPEEFDKLIGEKCNRTHAVAIRPETIAISKEKKNLENCYEFKGKVVESLPRGNVLRYTIDVNGIEISADTLFRSFSIFEDQSEVWLSLEKRNCLDVEETAV